MQLLIHTRTSAKEAVLVERADTQTEQEEIDHAQAEDEIRPCNENATNMANGNAL